MDRTVLYLPLINDHISRVERDLIALNLNDNFFQADAYLISLKKYLVKECDFFCLPATAYQVNLARMKGQLKGKTPNARYQYFFRHFDLFEIYPRLKELLTEFIRSTCQNYISAINQINHDKQLLMNHFSIQKDDSLVGVQLQGNSDRHHDGKQVLQLTFKSGLVLIYKPLLVHNERLIAKIFSFVNQKLNQELLPNYTFLEIEDRLYREYLPFEEKMRGSAEISYFYKSTGALLAVTTLTNTTDAHMENVVVHDGKLYLVDRETFFHHNQIIGFDNLLDVLSTGLLPNPNKDESNLSDTTGIMGGDGPRKSLTMPIVQNDGTDYISIKFIGQSNFRQHNRVTDARGKIVHPADYVNDIIDGFTMVADVFRNNKTDIIQLVQNNDDVTNRQVIRKTALYITFIREMFQPLNLINISSENKLQTELIELSADEKADSNKLIDYEINELSQLNIPYFYTKLFSRDLFDGNGNHYKDFFSETAFKKFSTALSLLEDMPNALLASKIKKSLEFK